MKYELLTAKSGKVYLKVTIGEYEAFCFPSRAEVAYLCSISEEEAHEDFLEA